MTASFAKFQTTSSELSAAMKDVKNYQVEEKEYVQKLEDERKAQWKSYQSICKMVKRLEGKSSVTESSSPSANYLTANAIYDIATGKYSNSEALPPVLQVIKILYFKVLEVDLASLI